MSKEIKFVLPLPPSINNNIWVNKKTGRVVQKDSCREWKEEVFFLLRNIPKAKSSDWKLEMEFNFHYVKSPRRIDMDNRCKPIIDAIAKQIGIDDMHLSEYTAKRKFIQGKTTDFVLCVLTLND